MPVHSLRACATWSAACPSIALAVVLSMSRATSAVALAVALMFSAESELRIDEALLRPAALPVKKETDPGRGWNQLLLKSKKHRSDQLHEVMNRINSRKEQ